MEENFFTEEKPVKATGMLNVLTILTFIGGGFQILFSAATPLITSFSTKMMDKAAEAGTQMTTKQLAELETTKASMALIQANMLPIVSSSILAAIGCIIGAVMMRKLKKDGLIIYSICEILPLIVGLILMGTKQFTGISSYLMSIGLPLLFIVLYASQKKQLTAK